MKAVKRGKIYSRERVRLEEVLPLKVPFSVQIDICSVCNLQCKFCFHSDLQAIQESGIKFGLMPYEVFTHIIDEFKINWADKGYQIKKLRLFKIGEPLLHPDVVRMIQYAKEANVAECIEITTNGTLLNSRLNQELIDAGLDILNISVNGINEKQYIDTCNFRMSFQEFRDNVVDFYQKCKIEDDENRCRIFIKYSDIGYSEKEKSEFYQLFGDICDEIFVETISATMWQDTNISKYVVNAHQGIYGQQLKKKQVCPFLFTTMVINDRGIAHICCMDWKSQYVLGDLKHESVEDIWNKGKLREFQKLHLAFKKDMVKICKNCESLSGNTIDDIDEYAQDIAIRMFGKR